MLFYDYYFQVISFIISLRQVYIQFHLILEYFLVLFLYIFILIYISQEYGVNYRDTEFIELYKRIKTAKNLHQN